MKLSLAFALVMAITVVAVFSAPANATARIPVMDIVSAVDESPPTEPVARANDNVAESPSSGIDVGLGADPTMDPDPSLYGTEVLCPDGTIWAVPIGEEFVCPT